MYRALFAFIAVGTVIGLAVPTSKHPPAAPAAVPQSDGQARETVLERESNGHFYVHAKVNGELVRFLVDTGASGVALTVEDAQRIGIPLTRPNSSTSARALPADPRKTESCCTRSTWTGRS